MGSGVLNFCQARLKPTPLPNIAALRDASRWVVANPSPSARKPARFPLLKHTSTTSYRGGRENQAQHRAGKQEDGGGPRGPHWETVRRQAAKNARPRAGPIPQFTARPRSILPKRSRRLAISANWSGVYVLGSDPPYSLGDEVLLQCHRLALDAQCAFRHRPFPVRLIIHPSQHGE